LTIIFFTRTLHVYTSYTHVISRAQEFEDIELIADQTKPKPEIRMGRLTGADARRILKTNPVILLPMGSQEDQGPHAPMGDYLLAERLAELAAHRAQAAGVPTYVAPVIPYGGDDFFRPALGGMVLEHSTMTALLTDVVSTLIDTGLNRVIMINGHGGNVNPIFLVAREIYRKTGIVVPSIYLWEAAYAMLPDIVGAEATAKRSGHGADPLGSVALHLMPELVRAEYFPEHRPLKTDPLLGLPFTNLGRARLGGISIGLPYDYTDTYNDGVAAGDPRLCDPATGAELTNRLVSAISELAALLFRKTK
jgi:creatinine amidohydrolase